MKISSALFCIALFMGITMMALSTNADAMDRLIDVTDCTNQLMSAEIRKDLERMLGSIQISPTNAVSAVGTGAFYSECQVATMATNLRVRVEALQSLIGYDNHDSPALRQDLLAPFTESLASRVRSYIAVRRRGMDKLASYGDAQNLIRESLGRDLYDSTQKMLYRCLESNVALRRIEAPRLLVQVLCDGSCRNRLRGQYDRLMAARMLTAASSKPDDAEAISCAEGLAYLGDSHGLPMLIEAMNATNTQTRVSESAAHAALFLNRVDAVISSNIMRGDASMPVFRLFDSLPDEMWDTVEVNRLVAEWLLKLGEKERKSALAHGDRLFMSKLALNFRKDRKAQESALPPETVQAIVGLAKRYGRTNDVRMNQICGDLSFLAVCSADIEEWIDIAKTMVDDFARAQILSAISANCSNEELMPHVQDFIVFTKSRRRLVRGRALEILEKCIGKKYVHVVDDADFQKRVDFVVKAIGKR